MIDYNISRSMSKTEMAPAPINLFTSWMTYLAKFCKKGTKFNSCIEIETENKLDYHTYGNVKKL